MSESEYNAETKKATFFLNRELILEITVEDFITYNKIHRAIDKAFNYGRDLSLESFKRQIDQLYESTVGW